MNGPNYAWALHCTRLEWLATDKHLLGPFVSYEENEVLWLPAQPYPQIINYPKLLLVTNGPAYFAHRPGAM
jgi:hypothetical protein